ncbi:MAG TPA: hypothetical protein DDW52_17585, partial [Planctomycetaceae bacterium]|nr:hypothetical protein [Planctomycetaceae bacterium]
MSDLLLYYQRPEPATWVFLSSFLLLGIYFVFHRFFSIRNLDLVLLVLLAPGLMMVYEGRQMHAKAETAAAQLNSTVEVASAEASTTTDDPSNTSQEAVAAALSMSQSLEYYGFMALLIACSLLMTRMLLDCRLHRRPLLVPNLSIGGLSFLGVSMFVFLMANVITSSPREQQLRGPSLGPGYALLNMLPELPTIPPDKEQQALAEDSTTDRDSAGSAGDAESGRDDSVPIVQAEAPQATDAESSAGSPWLPNVARSLAIVSNLAILLGIVGIGYWHFDNVQTGIGCAVMYLLLPYTAQMTGNLQHVVPAAFLVLAMLMYRQPLIAGALLGLAAGLVYYPLFLLPLWISFYWHRGRARLLTGIGASLALLAGLLLLQGIDAFTTHLRWMFGLWEPRMDGLEGIWAPGGIPADYRLPVLVGFILLSFSFVFWPSRKNLGSLMCNTAAILLAAQFWHGNGGGLYMAWFLPFTLLT